MTRQSQSRWYVIRTRPMRESKARAALNEAGFGVYQPTKLVEYRHKRTRGWRRRSVRLMPGYLLVEFPVTNPDDWYERGSRPSWMSLRRCEGVDCPMGIHAPDGSLVPYPVPSQQVEMLIAGQAAMLFDDTDEGRLRRREIGRNARETTAIAFPVGAQVVAVDGPFATRSAEVVGITASGQVAAMVAMMARLVPVEFPPAHIARLEQPKEAA